MNGTLWHRLIHPLTGYFRRKRSGFLLQNFPGIYTMKICDLGGSRHFWDKLGLDIPKANVTIFNISSNETAAIRDNADGQIKIELYDGTRIPASDGAYDLLICNSVIEHVPPFRRTQLAREMQRVAKNIFCQTPAWSFPVDPHFIMPFIHWLPKKAGYYLALVSPWRILARPSKEVIQDYFWNTNLLKKKELTALFPEGKIYYERFLGLPKSYYVIDRAKN